MTKTLINGENITLAASAAVNLNVITDGVTQIDVSSLLLDHSRKVRSDRDLVFFNNPRNDGVTANGSTISADLATIPTDVAAVVIVASIDQSSATTQFTTAPQLTVKQDGITDITFTPNNFTSGETVIVLAEVYRRESVWKIRAIGQGYASGLAGLATDYGVIVDDDGTTDPHTDHPSSAGKAIDMTKLARTAPALVPIANQARQALSQSGALDHRAAVYLVLDHSHGTRDLYDTFAVQAFAERILALATNLDDDGTVPVVFSTIEPFLEEITLDNYRGRIGQLHTQIDWGWDDTAKAMQTVVNHYQESASTVPAIAIVHVSEEPYDKSSVRMILQNTSSLGIFWMFVGFGSGKLAFYKNLNASRSATFSNVGFYDAGKNPGAVPGDKFFDQLVTGFARWLSP